MPLAEEQYIQSIIAGRRSADQELLRQLLCCFVPDAQADWFAARLMDQRDSLRYLCEMPRSLLDQLPGLPEKAALALSLIKDIAQYARLSELAGRRVLCSRDACEQMCARLFLEKCEKALLVALDARMGVVDCVSLGRGDVDRAILAPSDMLSAALRAGAKCVLLGHNHPGGAQEASRPDVEATVGAMRVLSGAGIPLIDHVIVARGEGFSLRAMDLINDADWLAQGDIVPNRAAWLAARG